MIKLIQILIVAILSFSSFSYSQSGAAKSLEIGNKWIYSYEPGFPSQCDLGCFEYSHVVVGDTIINNNKYAIIEHIFYSYTYYGDDVYGSPKYLAKAYIYQRADSTKVYSFSIDDLSEKIILDFETLPWDNLNGSLTVEHDTVTFFNKAFASMRLHEEYAGYCVDGGPKLYLKGIGLFSINMPVICPLAEAFYYLVYTKIGNQIFDETPNFTFEYPHFTNSDNIKINIHRDSGFDSFYNLKKLNYRINNSTWYTEDNTMFISGSSNNYWYHGPYEILIEPENEGKNIVEILITDRFFDEDNETIEIIVDRTPPTIEILNSDYSNIYYNEIPNKLHIQYSVNDLNFDKIGHSVNNSDWIWSKKQQSTLTITVENNNNYIQIKAVDLAGNESEIIEINVEKIADFKLSQNFPNPFNPSTQISYELPKESDVELIIYNTLGNEVLKLVNENQAIGRYNIDWNGQNSHGEQIPGGIYFYTIRTKDFTQTRKMLLLR